MTVRCRIIRLHDAKYAEKKSVPPRLACKCYEMLDPDGMTSLAKYPTADVFSGTLTIWF